MKKFTFFTVLTSLAVMFSLSASAYIDPSATSALVAGLAGLVVACSATAFIIWRRLRAKVSKTLGIDENAGKEVEDELTISEDAQKELDKKD